MREIKFRAWDKKLQRFIGGNFTLHEIHRAGGDAEIEAYWSMTPNDLADVEDVEFQQYTGLKDKNGVEIYEGDIVKFKTRRIFKAPRVSTRTFKSPVVFEDCCFLISEIQENDCTLWCDKENQLEVIGNIYENKDLLT